jgi:hypothetical protein
MSGPVNFHGCVSGCLQGCFALFGIIVCGLASLGGLVSWLMGDTYDGSSKGLLFLSMIFGIVSLLSWLLWRYNEKHNNEPFRRFWESIGISSD